MLEKPLHPEPDFTIDAARLTADRDVGHGPAGPQRANRLWVVLAVVLALALAVVAAYRFWPRGGPVPQQSMPTPDVAAPTPLAVPEPAIANPVERIPVASATDSGRAAAPLPGLDASDTAATDSIAAILNGDTYLELLVPPGIIRRIVATVDNLPRKTLAARILPVKAVPGAFATATTAGRMSIAAGNSARYASYVAAAESINTDRLAQLYVRLYPLFQQAYVELGYPNGYFNDRLISVIDHLLAAPEPKAPVYLAQPRIMFEFADPELEDLSAGQKVLVRIGAQNEMRIKSKLRELRRALSAGREHP